MFQKIYKTLTVLAIVFSSISLQADLPEPYNSINVLPFDGHGWFLNENALKLEYFISTKNPKVAIEVGSWLGCSARHIASHMQEDGVLYCIDTWQGSSEHDGDARLLTLYQQFLSNTIHAGLAEKIVPVRMTSIEAAQALNVKADLIYVDGAHDTDSVRNDILAWFPHLNEGGTLCGDDWCWPSVQVGVIQAAQKLKKGLYTFHNFWWLE